MNSAKAAKHCLRRFSWRKTLPWLLSIGSLAWTTQTMAMKIIKKEVLDGYIKEYRESGKPINIAIGCASKEINQRIRRDFNSKVEARENWIGIDIELCMHHGRGEATTSAKSSSSIAAAKGKGKDEEEENSIAEGEDNGGGQGFSGPDIQMNAFSKSDWKELIRYFKKEKVEISGIMFEGLGLPLFQANFLWKSFNRLLKSGGHVYGKGYFNFTDRELIGKVTNNPMNGIGFDGLNSFLAHRLIGQEGKDVRKIFLDFAHRYHQDEGSAIYKNEKLLLAEVLAQMKKGAKRSKSEDVSEGCHIKDMVLVNHVSKIRDAEVAIAALAYTNRIKHFNPTYISSDWRWRPRSYGMDDAEPLFDQEEEDFLLDYLPMMESYMKAKGFRSVALQCPKDNDLLGKAASCKQVVPYQYVDGTYDMSFGLLITK